MAVRGDWDDWIDKFISKIEQILGSEVAKCQARGVSTSSKASENDILYTRTVTKIVSGKQLCLDTQKGVRKDTIPAKSIGRLYKSSLFAYETTSGN